MQNIIYSDFVVICDLRAQRHFGVRKWDIGNYVLCLCSRECGLALYIT